MGISLVILEDGAILFVCCYWCICSRILLSSPGSSGILSSLTSTSLVFGLQTCFTMKGCGCSNFVSIILNCVKFLSVSNSNIYMLLKCWSAIWEGRKRRISSKLRTNAQCRQWFTLPLFYVFILLLDLLFIFYEYKCFVYIFVCAQCVCVVPMKVRRGSQISWN